MATERTLELKSRAKELNPNITGNEIVYNNDLYLTCYEREDLASTIQFLYIFTTTFQYILIIISVIGILINTTGIYILSTTKSMKNTFNFLLVTLYSFDNIFLVSHIFLCLVLKYNRSPGSISIVMSRFVKLLYSAAFNASTLFIVGISHERYIAMRHPLIHHQLMESNRNRQLHFIKYLVPIIIVSFVLVVPEYLDLEFVWAPQNASNMLYQTVTNHR